MSEFIPLSAGRHPRVASPEPVALLLGVSALTLTVAAATAYWRLVSSPADHSATGKKGGAAALTKSGHPNSRLSLARGVAMLILLLVTVVWGLQQPLIKMIVGSAGALDSAALIFLRFGLGALCFVPWLP